MPIEEPIVSNQSVKTGSSLPINLGLGMILIFMTILALTLGSARLSPSQVGRVILEPLAAIGLPVPGTPDPIARQIILAVRLPRIILAILVGAALSIAGVIFQGLFRNPMADPVLIGTSSGASLGATLAMTAGLNLAILHLNAIPAAAFAGSLLTTILVYNLAKTGRNLSMTVLLLAGVAVASFFSAITSTLMVLDRRQSQNILLWMLGGFSTCRWSDVGAIIPYLTAGIVLCSGFIRQLDIMLLGEEKAYQLGVNLQLLQKVMIFAASLLVAVAVSVSGTIGFVGLVVPHIVRLVIGPGHKRLLPAAALSGGIFLLAADTLARTILSPQELPVGILTSFLGAPFFIYLLRKSRREVFKY